MLQIFDKAYLYAVAVIGMHYRIIVSQKTQNICIIFIQCWTNVEDVGPTLYKVIQMFCFCWVSTLTTICSTQLWPQRTRK